jgi:hypothetical protein
MTQNSPRHCERSEAIQTGLAASKDWIASELTLLAMTGRVKRQSFPSVMRGLDPRIHIFRSLSKTWMPGSSPRMTPE